VIAAHIFMFARDAGPEQRGLSVDQDCDCERRWALRNTSLGAVRTPAVHGYGAIGSALE
jgi:hypothetical protein